MADPPPSEPKPSGFSAFWQELRRRHVVRVAAVYLVVGWLVIQVANATFEDFGIPVWAYRFVVLMVALGFPISVVLAWAFELTPEGIKTTRAAIKREPNAGSSVEFTRKRKWLTFAFGAAVPTLIFGTLALFFFIRSGGYPRGPDDKSIAVIPFDNLSQERDDYFSDGIHDELLARLAKIQDMRVISRTSVLEYRETEKKIPQIADELNVSYVLEGSVQRYGDRVKLTVQLIEAANDQHLWAEVYDRKFDDIFAIQTELSNTIANSLKSVVTPEESKRLEASYTENLEAYDLFLRAEQGLKEITTYGVSENFSGAATWDRIQELVKMYDQIIEMDPNMAMAYASRSGILHMIWHSGWDRSETLIESSLEDAKTAIRLAPYEGFGYLAMGKYLLQTADFSEEPVKDRVERARLELFKAESMMPGSADPLRALSWSYRLEGDLKESLDYRLKTVVLDPRNIRFRQSVRAGYWELFDYEEAKKQTVVIGDLNVGGSDEVILTFQFLKDGNIDAYFGALKSLAASEGLDPNEYISTSRWRGWVEYLRNSALIRQQIEREDLERIRFNPHELEPEELRQASLFFMEGKYELANHYADLAWEKVEPHVAKEARPYAHDFYKGVILFYKGDPEAIPRFQATAKSSSRHTKARSRWWLAKFYALNVHKEKALDQIDLILTDLSHGHYHPTNFLYHWSFDGLHDHPRFREIIGRFYSDEVIDQAFAWIEEQKRLSGWNR